MSLRVSRPRGALSKLLLLATGVTLAIAVIVLSTLSFQRKVDSFRGLGFEVAAQEAGWLVTEAPEGPASAGRVIEGDLILLVNGAEARSAEELRRQLHRGESSRLEVLRGDELVTVALPQPALEIDWSYLTLATIAALYLLIGLYTLFKNRRSEGLLFYAWCLLYTLFFALSPLGIYDSFDRWVDNLDAVARILLPALTLHFFLVFPRFDNALQKTQDPALIRWMRRALPFAYLPAVLLLTLQVDLRVFDGALLLGGFDTQTWLWLQRATSLHLVAFTLAAGALLIYRGLAPHGNWDARSQALWIAFGMTVGYVPYLIYTLASPTSLGALWNSELLEVLTVAPMVAVPLACAWAILRYKLWDLDIILRDAVSTTATVIVGLLAFTVIDLGFLSGLAESLGITRNVLSFGSGLMIAALVAPMRSRVATSLERLQYRDTYRSRRALTRLGERLLSERDLAKLCFELLDRLEESLELERVNLYLAVGDRLKPMRSEEPMGSGQPIPTLPLDPLGVDAWERDMEPLSGAQVPGAEGSAQSELFTAGYRYAFPLSVRGTRHLGMAVVGYKLGDRPLNSDDQELIRNLLNQAALAIENAQLLHQLRSQLRAVESLRQYSEGIIESSPVGMAVIDEEDHLISANRAFRHLIQRDGATGEAAEAGAETDTVADHQTTLGAPPGAAALASTPAPSTPTQGADPLAGEELTTLLPVSPLPRPQDGIIEVGYCSLDGEERYLELSIAPLQAEMAPTQVLEPRALAPRNLSSLEMRSVESRRQEQSLRVLVVHDVTEQRAMEHAMREQDRLASLGLLAAGVAHEVNTPLTGISSYAQMLLTTTPEDDPRRELLSKVERQSFRASRIVNNLLDFARSRSDGHRSLDLGSLVSDTLDLLKERFTKRSIRLRLEIPEAPLTIVGNDGELQQVFTNLFLNAQDAMSNPDATGVGIQQLTVRLAVDGAFAKVEIEDTGVGIAPERLEKIFEPFHSSKLGQGGTGLGLTISYDIVRKHEGTLRATSQPGVGTLFTVRLPLQLGSENP
ncbi:MAG: ATP-binding protein [Acidobacteriota bacterium]